jgi:hypothetical protein
MSSAFTVLFLAVTVLRVRGSFTHLDLRIVAHVVPARYHPRVLALVHPLVHLGDAVVMVAVVLASMVGLRLAGYRRSWAMLVLFLSWPIEFACKAVLPQPDGLGTISATVTVKSLVHGTGTTTMLAWVHHATPGSLQVMVSRIGGEAVRLVSSYPSGTAARGTFVLCLVIWLCLRLRIPVLSELLVLLLLAPLLVLGLAMVLYAWHWPSDVLGGYILGFALLSIALAILRRPVRQPAFRIAARQEAVPYMLQDNTH